MCGSILVVLSGDFANRLGFCGPGFGAFSGGACEAEYEEIATADDFDRKFGSVAGEDSSDALATPGLWMFSLTLASAVVVLA